MGEDKDKDRRELAIGPVLPLVTAGEAAESWQRFEELKEKILGDEDYQLIQNRRFIKRSGFRKIALFFGISDRILKEERIDRPDNTFSWRIVVEAVAKGRSCTGVGACDSRERKFAHTEHDVYATAHTRAKSRAISDMVAGGIVSAEEVEAGPEPPQPAQPTQPAPTQFQRWEPKVPVTKDPLNQPSVKQFPLAQGTTAIGMLNVLEDGSEASIVPEAPVRSESPAIQGFLIRRVLQGMAEKSPGFKYFLDADGEFLYSILVRGKIEEAQVKDLSNAARWAFQKAMERMG